MSPARRIALGLVVVLAAGCTTTRVSPGACVVIGVLAGGAAGAAAGNPNHGDDQPEDAARGAAIGAVLGGVAGALVCEVPNELPRARASATPSSGDAPLVVELRGTGTDRDGEVVAYAWDLGDGGAASGSRVAHTYGSPGTYTATLTVTDDDGATATATARVVARAAAPAPPPEVRRRIVLRGVNFDFDSASIRPDARPILDTALAVLLETPDVRVEVAGHTDATGPDAYNQVLAERRARAVAARLVEGGLREGRLVVRGYGESRPVADNATREGRAQNRRVELNVIE